jgi:hypothetical protein
MTNSVNFKTRFYSGLLACFMLLVPLCNLGAIRFGFHRIFHDEAELVLFLLYGAPLWVVLILIIVFELYRQVVMKVTLGRNMVSMMALGGLVFSGLWILLCPVGPKLFSVASGELILVSTCICTVLGVGIHQVLRLRQQD